MTGAAADRAIDSRETFKRALVEFISGPLSSRHGASTCRLAIEGSTPLFESGVIDSVGILDLLAFVENAIGRPLSLHEIDLKFFGTVDRICNSFWPEERERDK